MKVTVALIHWIDSTYYKHDSILLKDIPSDYHKPRELLTVGILVDETDDFISICQCVDSEVEYTRKVLSIPKVSIKAKPICMEVDVSFLKQKNKKKIKGCIKK